MVRTPFIHSFLLSLILLASPSSLLSLSLLLSPSSHPLALLSPSFRPLPSTSSRSLLTQISLYFPLFPLPLLFLFSRPLLLLSSSFPLHFPSLILPLLFLFFFYPCHRSRPSPYSLILLSSSTSDLPLLTIFSSSFSPSFLSISLFSSLVPLHFILLTSSFPSFLLSSSPPSSFPHYSGYFHTGSSSVTASTTTQCTMNDELPSSYISALNVELILSIMYFLLFFLFIFFLYPFLFSLSSTLLLTPLLLIPHFLPFLFFPFSPCPRTLLLHFPFMIPFLVYSHLI